MQFHEQSLNNDIHNNKVKKICQHKILDSQESKESESSVDSYLSGSGTDTTNDIDTKTNMMLNNLYNPINSNTRDMSCNKSAIPMANQINLNCINNIHNNISYAKNLNDTISATFSNINQNGLPSPPSNSINSPIPPIPCDKTPVILAKQSNNSYVNRNNTNFIDDSSKQYVIQNRNGLLVNGTSDKESIKLEPKGKLNKMKMNNHFFLQKLSTFSLTNQMRDNIVFNT